MADRGGHLAGVNFDLGEGLEGPGDLSAQLTEELVRSAAETGRATGAVFRPTVLVGVGGTGVQSVRRAKRRIAARVGRLPTLTCVYFDSDVKSLADAPGLAPVEQSELCFIGGRDLLPLVENPAGHDWLFGQIPGKIPPREITWASRGEGCGQRRAVGRVALLVAMPRAREILGRAIRSVQALAAEMSTRIRTGVGQTEGPCAQIYIVCSLAGGTGSGAFLDVALLARTLAGPLAQIVGVFVLPNTFDEKAQGDPERLRINRANTYAALKELQALQDGDQHLRLELILNSAGESMALTPQTPIFDLTYFVDIKNENQRRLSRMEDVFELVARLLLHENASPMGPQAHSVQRNLNTLREIARCPETGLPRTFSSFACTRLGFPIDRLTAFCAWSTLREVLADELLRAPLAVGRRQEEVQAFLTVNELDEQGQTDQVIEHLLRDDNGAPISETSEGIQRNFGQEMTPARFVTAIRQKMDAFNQRSLTKAKQAITKNLAFYLGEATLTERPLAQKLDVALNEWLGKYGSHGASGILDELIARATALRGEMIDENDAWAREDARSQLDAWENSLSRLGAMSRVHAWASATDERLKAEAISAFQVIVREELRVPARNAAIRVYDELLSLAKSRKQAVESFSSCCETLARELNGRLQALRVEGRRETSYFIVDIDVTERGFLEEFYAQNRVSPATLLKESQQTAGEQAYFVRLLALTREGLIREFGERAAARYGSKVRSLDVVSYISSKAGGEGAVAVKLEELFDMCVPFWSTRLPQAGMQYEQHAALGCMPRSGIGDEAIYPPEVQQWVKQYTTASTGATAAPPAIVPTTVPYELELVRYVHGARASYLTDAAEWKQKYEQTAASDPCPLHTHTCLGELPDIVPTRAQGPRREAARRPKPKQVGTSPSST